MKTMDRRRNRLFLLAIAVLLVAGAGTIKLAISAEGEKESVRAYIDDECRSNPAEFSVPEGKTATGFSSSGVKEGKACHDGGAPENVGYSIRDGKGKPVYMWSRYKDQPPYEKGGPLSSVELYPGDYKLTVAGGAGAEVVVSYTLK